MKVLFVVNENHVDIFSSFINTKETFGDEVKVISKTEEFNQDGWTVIRDEDSKENSLILDLVGNYKRHGLPSNPRIKKPEDKKAEKKEQTEREANVCPECFEVIESSDVCEYCGAELVQKKIIDEIRLEEIRNEPKKYRLVKLWYKENYTTKKNFKGTLFCAELDGYNKTLFKFCGHGTEREQFELRRVQIFQSSSDYRYMDKESYVINGTAYGNWLSGGEDKGIKDDIKELKYLGKKLAPFDNNKVALVYS